MARTAPAAPVTKARVKRKSPESYKTHRNAAALLTALSRRVADGAKGATRRLRSPITRKNGLLFRDAGPWEGL